VDGDRNEVLPDITGEIRVGVRFGFQPSAGNSSWGGTEVDQEWLAGSFGLAERRIRIFDPVH